MTSEAVHWLLLYELVDDYLDRRAAFRAEHFAHTSAAVERGELAMAGAMADPADGAVLVFRSPSAEPVEDFARADPYVVNGLVRAWSVRRWRMVVGDGAEPA